MFNVYSVRTGGRGDVGARYLSFADFCSKRWGHEIPVTSSYNRIHPHLACNSFKCCKNAKEAT